MKERLSKSILLVEALLFLLPLSFLSVWYAQFWIRIYIGDITSEVTIDLGIVALFTAIAIQIIAWFVLIRFLVGGRSALLQLRNGLYWTLVGSAFVVVLGAIQFIASVLGIRVPNLGMTWLWDIAFWGIPVLIPFSHIAIERHLAKAQG